MKPRHAAQPESMLVNAMNRAVALRTGGVLAILFASSVVNAVRLAVSDDHTFQDEPVAVPLAVGCMLAYQAATLVWLLRLRDRNRPLPSPWVYSNAVIEAAFPTVVAMLISLSGTVSLEQVSLGPLSHMYAIFVVLSVMHVRLAVTAVSAVVSAGGFFAILVLAQHEPAFTAAVPASLAMFSVVPLLGTGVAAGLVAVRTRGYLEAASGEATARARAERDLQTAAQIQKRLMPSTPPDIAGYEVAGWNRPADETGGDYFDWLVLEDDRLAVCIADVTGHGLGPAMITCFCRAYARSVLRVGHRISAAIQLLNDHLINDLEDGRFVTFAALVVTPDVDQVYSTSAGHGPLLLYRSADGSVESFGADALPLGVHSPDDDDLEAVAHTLRPGDAFVLLTDGFFEWANPSGEQFGTPRLRESLSRHGEKSATELIQGLLRDVETFSSGTPQPDDLTAVVVRRSPASGLPTD